MRSQSGSMKQQGLLTLLTQRLFDISNHWPAASGIIVGVFAPGEAIGHAAFHPLRVVL